MVCSTVQALCVARSFRYEFTYGSCQKTKKCHRRRLHFHQPHRSNIATYHCNQTQQRTKSTTIIQQACAFLSLVDFIPSLAHPLLLLAPLLPLPITVRFHHKITVEVTLHRPNNTTSIYLLCLRLASTQHTLNCRVNIRWCTRCAVSLQRRS